MLSKPKIPVAVVDCCVLCGFVFSENSRKRKRNVVGELAKMFEEVFNRGAHGVPRAICNTCCYKVEKLWKEKRSLEKREDSAVIHPLKRKHPVSPLSSSKGDVQIVTIIERKKGHRLCFENDSKLHPLQPKLLPPSVSATHAKEQKATFSVSTQTSRSSSQWWATSMKKTSVKIIVHYPSKTISKELPAHLNSLGIALCKAKATSAVSLAAFKSIALRRALTNRACLELDKECRRLEKKSVLKCTSLEDLKKFKWSKLTKEWQKEAPTLYKVLRTIAIPPRFSKKKIKCLRPVICSAGAMLLRSRNLRMSAVQHLVGLSLFLGRTRKKGFTRLQKLGMCVNRNATNQKIKEMSHSFQKKIKSWKASMEQANKSSTLPSDATIVSETSTSPVVSVPQNEHQVAVPSFPDGGEMISEVATDMLLEENQSGFDTSGIESDSNWSSESSELEEEAIESSFSTQTDFGLNGDNLDWIRRPSIYSEDRNTESVHWFNLIGYDNRVVDWDLNDKNPIRDIKDLENSTFLPSLDDHAKLKDEFVVLVLRILVKNCKYFEQFASMVPTHLPHPYSKQMSHQSQVINLGLLDKNENKGDEMLQILQFCSAEYVPVDADANITHKINFGGDHLTVERAISAVSAVADSDSPQERLEGLILKHEEFHCEMNILQMIFDYLYKENSASDIGTLCQLRARLNRKDVHSNVNKSYHGCESFFSTVVDGYVVYAAMEFFGMESLDSIPSVNVPQAGNDKSQERAQLYEKVGELINKYVLFEAQVKLRQAIEQTESCHERYNCRFPSCDKTYVHEKRRDNHEVTVHGLTIPQNEESPPNPADGDGVFNYSHNILKTGLLLRNFQDAIKEGDGMRLERLWKFNMLLFKVTGKHKYALAAIRLHAQLNALLTPREAHCLRWNRTINLKGGIGQNVPIDQVQEHRVKNTKELMYGHGANLTFPSAQMYSRASDGVVCVMRNFDLQNKVHQESSKHTRRQDTDIKTVVKILQEIHALKEIPGRTHRGIGTVPKDPVSALDFNDLSAWISKFKRKCRV